MKKFAAYLLAGLFGVTLTLSAVPPSRDWFTDYQQAQQEAKAKKLPMFLLFTGSDWCPWCKKLDKDTLKTSKFKKFTQGKVILVYLDFPRETKLPKNIVKQNEDLAKKFEIQGFPTIVITDVNGKQLGQLGYAKVNEFLPQLEKILKKH